MGRTPSGVRVTVQKTMIGKTQVASAKVLPADPTAADDEYLIPANAKTTAGFVDQYEHFAAKPSAWSDVAMLTFTFSRPVRDPHLHVFGTGGSSGDARNHDDYWPAIELVGGIPATPAFARVAGFPGYRTSATAIEPEWTYPTGSTTCGVVYACGTVRVSGTVSSFTVKLRAHDDRQGKGGPAPQLWAAFKLSLAEDDSDAPPLLRRGLPRDHPHDARAYRDRRPHRRGEHDPALPSHRHRRRRRRHGSKGAHRTHRR